MILKPVLKNGVTQWKFDYTVDGARQRRFFKTKGEGQAEIKALTQQQKLAGDAWIAMPPRERNEFMLIASEIAQAGLTLRQVWDGYRQGHPAQPAATVSLESAIAELIASKRKAERRKVYIHSLDGCLARFTLGRKALPVPSIKSADLEGWRLPAPRNAITDVNWW